MKKLMFFLIIIFSIRVFPQISPTVFPKIGFYDLYSVQKQGGLSFVDYYPRLHELGLNYVTSFTDNNSKTPALNNSIKIIDFAFGRGNEHSYNNPYKYAFSTGDNIDHFPYEAGGSNIAVLTTEGHNFGFGYAGTSVNSARSSWWVLPYNNECVGNTSYNDPQHDGTIVHYAQVGVHSTGIMLKAKPDAEHFPEDDRWGHVYNLRLRILARIDGAPGTVNVARVHIWEETPSSMLASGGTTTSISSNESIQNLMMGSRTGKTSTTNMRALTLTDYTYYITANDFGGNNYVELTSPETFRKTGELSTELYVTIEWLGTRNLYVDKIAIYSTYYDDLFIANSTTVKNTIKSDLESIFGSVKTHSSFAHPYLDEPYPMMYRSVGEVSNLSETQLGTGKYVNGATGERTVDRLMLANSQRRVPYVLYDSYPIKPNFDSTSTGTNSIQGAWDNLINVSDGNVGYGVERYRGISQAIKMAQNYTPDNTSDDVPFYHTIQVQAEKNVSGGIVQSVRFREPRYYEILAQGNLALCYGAKGMMYFIVSTIAGNDGSPNFYGLFEEQGHLGAIVQDPSAAQVSNYRFDATQKLNQYIDKISSEVLQLTWLNAYSIHKGQPTGIYISSLSSATTGGVTDASGSTYVELGTFKKTSDFSNTNLEYFMVVNRRILSSETRNITVTFNKSSSYTTWKVREVGTDNYWIVSNTGSIQATYTPGEGKLFKFEPLFLNSTETFNSATVVVNSSITVPSGKTLSITAGSTFNFANAVSLIVNGTLNAAGTTSSGITFTKSGANNWGGIQFNSGSSGNLQYCTLQYGTHGVYCYNSSPTISYSHIQNNQNNGVYCNYYSSPILDHGTIQNNYTGISCSNYSSPRLLTLGSYPGSNVIRNNGSWGVSASYYSNPAVGTSNYGGGYNSIYSNGGGTSAISANYYCTINANGNWWNGAPTILELNGSSVTALDPLATDPNAGRTRIVSDDSQSIDGMDISLSKQIVSDDLSGAQENENKAKYDEAVNLYLSAFKNSKDELLSRYILCKIEECFTKGEKKDYLDFSKREIKPIIKEGTEIYVVALELETHQMVNAGLYKDAVNNLLTILKKYNLNSDIEKNAFFTLGAFYSLYFGDKDNSDKYFGELKQKYPKDELVNQIGIIKSMGMISNGSLPNGEVISFSKETINETTKEITDDVVSNYPNPFNPSTQINFTLKESGKVSLKVYDVLGKEVANLAEGYYEAGKHAATFNGSNLASGIYFYRLTTPTATITKKMVLTK